MEVQARTMSVDRFVTTVMVLSSPLSAMACVATEAMGGKASHAVTTVAPGQPGSGWRGGEGGATASAQGDRDRGGGQCARGTLRY